MEPISWIKSKYREEKTKGRYKSAGGNGAATKKHKKNPQKQKATQQRVMVINKAGKTTWTWRAI